MDKITMAHELADISQKLLTAEEVVKFAASHTTGSTAMRSVRIGGPLELNIANVDLLAMSSAYRDRLTARQRSIQADMKWAEGIEAAQ